MGLVHCPRSESYWLADSVYCVRKDRPDPIGRSFAGQHDWKFQIEVCEDVGVCKEKLRLLEGIVLPPSPLPRYVLALEMVQRL